MQNDELDKVYEERNMLVAFLSKVYPSHLCMHDVNDKDWDDEWRIIVCVHSPEGQLTWHVHKSEEYLFDHLRWGDNHWDGHSTAAKYARLVSINPKADAE